MTSHPQLTLCSLAFAVLPQRDRRGQLQITSTPPGATVNRWRSRLALLH